MQMRLVVMMTLVAAPAQAFTELVADVRSGAPSSSPQSLTVIDGELYWLANGDDGVFGLWHLSDGVPTLVKDFRETDGAFAATRMIAYDDDFYFRGARSSPATGGELFRYDPVADQVQLVWDLASGSAASNPQYLTPYDGRLYFVANVNGTGIELRSTDGSFHETYDIWPGVGSAAPSLLTVFDGALWFSATSPQTVNIHPCRFEDGTPFFYTDIEQAGELTVWNGELYVTGKDAPAGRPKLFKLSGGVFVEVADVDPTDTVANPIRFLTPLDDGIYFAGNDGTHGYELWRFDGSATMLDDYLPGTDGIFPMDIAGAAGGVVYTGFGADDEELHVYDGATTMLLADIDETGSSSPENGVWNAPAAVIGGVYYFSADDGVNGRELWRTDGWTGTTPVAEEPVGGGITATGPLILSAPRPNPSAAATTFIVGPSGGGSLQVDAFDVAGRHVAELFSGRLASGKAVTLAWDLSTTAPGTYFVRLREAGGASQTRRVVRMP